MLHDFCHFDTIKSAFILSIMPIYYKRQFLFCLAVFLLIISLHNYSVEQFLNHCQFSLVHLYRLLNYCEVNIYTAITVNNNQPSSNIANKNKQNCQDQGMLNIGKTEVIYIVPHTKKVKNDCINNCDTVFMQQMQAH